MKRIVGILLLSVVFIGCKGEKGDRGSQGTPGLSGLSGGQLVKYTGPITSDAQFINIPAYSSTSQISVYLSNGSITIQLPLYAAGDGNNLVYFIGNSGQLEIINAQIESWTTYKIIVIN